MNKNNDNSFEIKESEKVKIKSAKKEIDKSFTYMGAAILVTILVLIVGIVISVITSNWSWFSRFGSIVVIIGILMTAYDIESSLKKSNGKFVNFILKKWKLVES